jgi:hypothetical protein
MTIQHSTDFAGAVAFGRLHALVKRGYGVRFDAASEDDASVELVHLRRAGPDVPPRLTLWSNGLISTRQILWPQKYVAQEQGPPLWQQIIRGDDSKPFDEFLSSVSEPTYFDRVIYPVYCQIKIFALMLLSALAVCCTLSLGLFLARALLRV